MDYIEFSMKHCRKLSLIALLVLPVGHAFADTDAADHSYGDKSIAPPVSVSISLLLPEDDLASGVSSGQTPILSTVHSAVVLRQFGDAADQTSLENERGGSKSVETPLSSIVSGGAVSNNRAVDVVTGSNAIREGSFANVNGLPVVIQNTGANVLIQNSTIVNVQLR